MRHKALIDSSCALAVVKPGFEPDLAKQLPSPGKDCQHYSSLYLRMEFFRLWVITGIEIYFRARRVGNLAKATEQYADAFGRLPKTCLSLQSFYLQHVLQNPPTEPIENWGWFVLSLARTYDKLLHSLLSPSHTQCKKGAVRFNMEFGWPTLQDLLRDFHERFMAEGFECSLDHLLGVTSGGRKNLNAIRQADEYTIREFPPKSRKPLKKIRQHLENFIGRGQVPDCTNCYKLGDLLIALEQPHGHTLYHTDWSFCAICPSLGKVNRRLEKCSPPARGELEANNSEH